MQASSPGKWPTRKRILFVDDDPVLGKVYASVLQSESHRWEVRSAVSGLQALDMMARGAL